MKAQSKRYYEFGLFRLDVTERALFGEKGIIPLTPKAFDTLLVMVENNNRLISKDELMGKVWPDSFVEENNLAQNISALRKALGEGSSGRKFIETVPKRGYRFIAVVRERVGRSVGRPETLSNDEMQAGCDERQHKNGKSFLRDVVIIGRAIDFK